MSSSIAAKRTTRSRSCGQLEPRRDVAVVVELRDDDLVAGSQLAAERRGVSAKFSVVMFAPKTTSSGVQPRKLAAGPARLVDQRLGPPARLVRAADVRVRLAQVVGDRVDHLVGHLRCRRARRRRRARGRAPRTGARPPRRRKRPRSPSGRYPKDHCDLRTFGGRLERDIGEGRPMGDSMEAAAVPAVDVAERAPGAVVAAQDLTRRYGEGDTAVDALRGVSLEVAAGQADRRDGPVGLRQVDADAHPRRARPADQRRRSGSPARSSASSTTPRSRSCGASTSASSSSSSTCCRC